MDIKNMSYKEIFNLYKKNIIEIRKDFLFPYIDEKEFIKIVVLEISKSMKEYEGNDYQNYLEKKIRIALLKKIAIILLNDDDCYQLMDKYFNNNFGDTSSLKSVQNNFIKLIRIFNKLSCVPSENVIEKLIYNNNLFRKNLDIMFYSYQEYLKNGGFNKMYDNYMMTIILEIYCEINNIDTVSLETKKGNKSDNVHDGYEMYLNDLPEERLLTRSEEHELFEKIRNGDMDAKTKIIERNLRLVISVAKKYRNAPMDFMDLVEEGNMGLMKAITKFDENKGYKFSTYATWWIRQSIMRAINEKARNIRIPVYILEKIGSYYNACEILETKLKRQPTNEEIAEYMKIRVSVVEKIEKCQFDTISINQCIGQDTDSEIINNIAADDGETPLDIIINKFMRECVNNLISKKNLKKRESEIIKMRFGFNDENRIYTLEEIGQMYHITRERVRQIENRLLKRLFYLAKSQGLYEDYGQKKKILQ